MAQGKTSNSIGRMILIGLALVSGLIYTVGRTDFGQPSSNQLLLTATAYSEELRLTLAMPLADTPSENRVAAQPTVVNAATLPPPTMDAAMAATGEWIRTLLTATALSQSAVSDTPVPTDTVTPQPSATSLPSATNTPTDLPTQTALPTIQPSDTATLAPSATDTATQRPTATNTPSPTASFTAVPPTQTDLPSATATPSFTAVVSATSALTGITHTVVSGETLYRIAQQYSSTVESIAAANRLPDFQIRVGQALLIPDALLPIATVANSSSGPASTQAVAPSATQLPSPTPTPMPPMQVNGLDYDDIVVISSDVAENIRAIYAEGQSLGRNSNAFTRLGDSTIEPPHFLKRFDDGYYHLGDYGHLQGVIDHYSGSFTHNSVAVRRGLHSWAIFDPAWAGYGVCNPGEHILSCEIRRHNPSVVIVRMGSNDRGVPDSVRSNLRRAVEYLIANGIVPIMGTKADRFEGPSDANNQIVREIARDYQLPLWDFDRVSTTIPGRGLGPDNVHLNFFFAHDWRQPQGFSTGHGMQNLTALIALDRVWQVLATSSTQP